MDAIWRTWVVVALAVTWWTAMPAAVSRAAEHLGALYTGQPEAWESARPPP
jgi:ABC-type sugar transport system substrate-binding protein